MKRKLLSLFLAGVMVIGVLAGCGNKTDDVQTEKMDEKDTGKESGSDSAEELTPVKILAKRNVGGGQDSDHWEDYGSSKILIEELAKRGIALEFEWVDGESFEKVVATRMAAGTDIPDLISYSWMDSAQVVEWGRNGLIYSMNELLDTYDEDSSIRKFVDEYAPGGLSQITLEDGELYWLPYLSNVYTTIDKDNGEERYSVSRLGLCIRADWVEAVGEEMKEAYTPDELFDLLKKMHDGDANGNGKQDEVLYCDISGFNNGIATAFGLSIGRMGGYFVGEDKFFNNIYHENFPAYIEFMQKLYENGLYDTQALSSTMEEMVSQDVVSACWWYVSAMDDYLPFEVDDKICYLDVLIDLDGDASNGVPFIIDPIETTVYNQYFVPSGAEHPEAVMKLMDYVYSYDYALLSEFGVEGKSYEIDENGQINILEWDTNDLDGLNLWSAGVVCQGLPEVAVLPSVSEKYPENATSKQIFLTDRDIDFQTKVLPVSLEANQIEYNTRKYAIASEEESAKINEISETLSTYVAELVTDLIMGNKSLDNLSDYQKELDELGMQEYIKIMQDRHDRYLANK